MKRIGPDGGDRQAVDHACYDCGTYLDTTVEMGADLAPFQERSGGRPVAQLWLRRLTGASW